MIWKTKPGEPVRDVKQLLLGSQKAALHVMTTIPRGTSFLNGVPSIAPDPWPQYKGRKLDLLAQIDLSHTQALLPMDWLPKQGALLVFYATTEGTWGSESADYGSWAVIHQPVMSRDLTTSAVAPSDPGYGRVPVTFRTILNYPGWERVSELGLSSAEKDALEDLRSDPFGQNPFHQLGGLPFPIQNDGMEQECERMSHRISAEKGAGDWRLLLQLDSDEAANWQWGDGGMLYFFVRESQARAGDFSDVWMQLQCY